LAQVVRTTVERGGKLIIPAFAIGRVEELLYWMRRLEQERRIPVVPVYVDSPMANGAIEVLFGAYHRARRGYAPDREERLDVCDHAISDSVIAAAIEGTDGQP
jgi:Cft2 family RNA processing exonuclease